VLILCFVALALLSEDTRKGALWEILLSFGTGAVVVLDVLVNMHRGWPPGRKADAEVLFAVFTVAGIAVVAAASSTYTRSGNGQRICGSVWATFSLAVFLLATALGGLLSGLASVAAGFRRR
jgi:hypothetical protein